MSVYDNNYVLAQTTSESPMVMHGFNSSCEIETRSIRHTSCNTCWYIFFGIWCLLFVGCVKNVMNQGNVSSTEE